MREIKFRAWNDIQKKMFAPFNMYEMVQGHLDYDEQEMDDSKGFPVGTIFLEFTGLKDKNGKEIYEGDIIKWSGNIGLIEWNDSDASFFINFKHTDNKYSVDHCEDSEVIGNKFENPELVK